MPDRKCQVKNRDIGILPYGGAAKGSGEAAREAELSGKKAAQRGIDRKVGTSEFSQIGSLP
jgi:hypothetical protein